MPTTTILILFRLHTHTNTALLTHLIGTQCFKFQALSILMIPHYGHRLFRRNRASFPRQQTSLFQLSRYRSLVQAMLPTFINGSGCLNPHLSQLDDNGEAYRQWQQHMRSHQRRDTRSSSSSDRRRNSYRCNDNNRYRNNHGGHSHEPTQSNSRNNGQGLSLIHI